MMSKKPEHTSGGTATATPPSESRRAVESAIALSKNRPQGTWEGLAASSAEGIRYCKAPGTSGVKQVRTAH